jgi:hypothetical protein
MFSGHQRIQADHSLMAGNKGCTWSAFKAGVLDKEKPPVLKTGGSSSKEKNG